MALSPEARRALTARQAALTALSNHPSWPELEAVVAEKGQKMEREVARLTLGGLGAIEIDERTLLYLRGFLHGMKWMVAVPTQAENSLERYLRAQGIKIADDEEAAA